MAFLPRLLPLPSQYHLSNSVSLTFHSNSSHLYPKHSILCLASSNKSRPSRKLISDEELCNGLKEFVASVGLPQGHVPSTKQLAQHGRKDLANIVRRRGHKLIKELLASTTKPATDEYDSWESLSGEFSESRADEDIGQEEKVDDYSEEKIDLINDESVLDASLVTVLESAERSDDETPLSVESPVSLQEKVENFMKYGELDAVEDDAVHLSGHEPTMHDEEKLARDSSSTGSNGTLILQREIDRPIQSQQNIGLDLGMSSELNTIQAIKIDDEDEIDRLKIMLHQKELELSRLKKEIEEEKEALSILQTKAEEKLARPNNLLQKRRLNYMPRKKVFQDLWRPGFIIQEKVKW